MKILRPVFAIIAGIAAVAGIAIGLVIGLLRGQGALDRLREELTTANESLQLELAQTSREVTARDVQLEQMQRDLQERIQALRGYL